MLQVHMERDSREAHAHLRLILAMHAYAVKRIQGETTAPLMMMSMVMEGTVSSIMMAMVMEGTTCVKWLSLLVTTCTLHSSKIIMRQLGSVIPNTTPYQLMTNMVMMRTLSTQTSKSKLARVVPNY